MAVQRGLGEQALISGSQHYGGSTWAGGFISVFTPLCEFLCKEVLELIYMRRLFRSGKKEKLIDWKVFQLKGVRSILLCT